MPQAIAAAIVTAIGLTGTAAAIATAVIALAVTVGLNYVAQGVFGGGGVGAPSDGQRVVRVNVGSRVRHYGKVRVGGQLTFYESRDGTLYILTTTGHGRIHAVAEYLLNGKVVTLGAPGFPNGVADAQFKGALSLYMKTGEDDQSAHAVLVNTFAEWTADHRQRGCSSLLTVARGVGQEDFAEVYEGGQEPQATVTLETSLIYDPRKDSTAVIGVDEAGDPVMGDGLHRIADEATWEYSDNWALCFADYLAHLDGYGLGYEMVNWTNVAEEAAVCDEEVSTVDARTIPRWRMAGSYRMAEDDRRAVVREFLKAGDGFLFQDADGLANIFCGRWIEPSVHIPEKHILGCSASLGTNPQDRANEVRVIYMEPRFGYTETEGAPLVDAAGQLALGRPEVLRFDCYYCPDHNQGQRIGKRILARLGDRWAITLTTNLYGLNAIGERFITASIPEIGIEAMAFEVTALKIDPMGLSVELGLLEVRPADFDFDAATEEGAPPVDLDDTTQAVVIEAVSGLAVSSVPVGLNGADGVQIQAGWTAPARPGLSTQVQFKETASSIWREMAVIDEVDFAQSGVVSTGVEHEVRARHVTVGGRPSAWSAILTITPVAVSSDPNLITNGNFNSSIASWQDNDTGLASWRPGGRMRLERTGAGSTGGIDLQRQGLAGLEIGEDYRLSAVVRFDGSETINSNFYGHISWDGDAAESAQSSNRGTLGADVDQAISVTFTATSTSHYITLGGRGSATGVVDFDSVSVVKV